MNLILYVVIAAVIYGAGFGTGWQTNGWRLGAAEKERVEAAERAQQVAEAQRDEARAARDLIASNFETRLSNLRIINKTINQEVRHEVEKTVYGNPDCNLPESGVRLLNAAARAANEGRPLTAERDATVHAGGPDPRGPPAPVRRPVPDPH